MTDTPALDPRRQFTTTETTFAWLRQGGECPECHRNLDRDLFEGDHIIPWSKGGSSTDVQNIQLLCAAHNLSKSDEIV